MGTPFTLNKWTRIKTPAAFGVREGMKVLSYNNALYMTGGYRRSTRVYFSDVWKSGNGIAWTKISNGKFPGRYDHNFYRFDGKFWIYGGRNTTTINSLYSSTDAINWTLESASVPVISPYDPAMVEFDGYVYSIGGEYGIGGTRVYRASDGKTFSQVAEFGSLRRIAPSVVVFGGKLYVMGGYSDGVPSGGFNNEIWSTSDGVNWEQEEATPSWAARYHSSVFTSPDGARVCLVGGYDSDHYYGDVHTTVDMTTWSQVTQATPFTPNTREGAAVCQMAGCAYVMGGRAAPKATQLADVWKGGTQTNCYLKNLTPSAGTFVFTGESTGSMSTTATSIRFKPVAAVSTQVIRVNGTVTATNTLSKVIALSVGANTITILVTAPDKVTQKTYTITVTRT